jgi:hypothetical protein
LPQESATASSAGYNGASIDWTATQMSELILFTLNAIVVYLVSDWLVRVIERQRGGVLKQRQVVFFVIFLSLALISFQILGNLLQPPG